MLACDWCCRVCVCFLNNEAELGNECIMVSIIISDLERRHWLLCSQHPWVVMIKPACAGV